MFSRFGPIRRAVAFAMMVVAGSTPIPARAQFVPGRIFTVDISSFTCKDKLDIEKVVEIDPETGTTRIFAYFFDCPGLRSIAMSPDGKHLRVAASHWGAILEFDSLGNWEIVIDGSDGVFPAADHNSITYDRHGNFYLSNYYLLNEKVVMFPADGGPKQVLAYSNNNGVIIQGTNALSVGPAGEVYAGDGNRLIRIGEDGVVSVFDDNFGVQAWINSILVDDFGYVHVNVTGAWFRYVLGNPSSRVLLPNCTTPGQGLCVATSLVLSPDRKTIYTRYFDPNIGPGGRISVVAVDPFDGTFETVVTRSVSSLGFTVVPLHADIDGDIDTDLNDLEWFVACLAGRGVAVSAVCESADMDADGDVDLVDARYFNLGYTAFAER